jgi:hypothetical protein
VRRRGPEVFIAVPEGSRATYGKNGEVWVTTPNGLRVRSDRKHVYAPVTIRLDGKP